MTKRVKNDTVDFEDELVKTLMEEIQKEIDFSVLSTMLVETGWTEVKLDPHIIHNTVEIIEWVAQYKIGNYHSYGSTFIFEKAEDAEWFILKWK